ncbi:MAG: SLBB domain-containing protein [Candidatus Levyibacteriota bacterium]
MDLEPSSLPDRIIEFIRKNLLISALLVIGLIFLVGGMMQLFLTPQASIEFQKGAEVSAASTSAGTQELKVDVSGEVAKPGVYSLASDARVQDALSAAGGLGSDADRDYVARSINLASPLKDGLKIYIPKIGEKPSAASPETFAGVQDSQGLISINNATTQELDSLPGVGMVTAEKIINGRPYSSVEELLNRKIVTSKVYNGIKDKLSL